VLLVDQRLHARLVADVQHVDIVLLGLHFLHEPLVLLHADDAQHFDLDAGIFFLESERDGLHGLERSALVPNDLAFFLGRLVERGFARGKCLCADAGRRKKRCGQQRS
jgi:hypothetical protein